MALSNLFDSPGELSKLTIYAYKTNMYDEKEGYLGKFVVMYNPNTFSRSYQSVWLADKPIGGAGENKKFNRSKSDNVSFEFLFDGTGVSHVNVPEKVGHVQEQINAFLDITCKISSSTYEPNFLILNWGDFIFQGVMDSATVTYKLFHSSGAPLRATINAQFSESKSPKEQAAATGKNSPDLTHIRIVKSGESLPSIAKEVYGDSSLYVEIARINELKNFRKLEEGMQLILPPIEEKVNG